MNKRLNKIVSFVLVVCMLLTLMPAGIFNNVFGVTESEVITNNDNWEVGVKLYDVTSGSTQIDNIVWNPTVHEKRTFELVVSYRNVVSNKTYNPGDVQVEIDSILDNIRDCNDIVLNSTFYGGTPEGYPPEFFIDADKASSATKTNLWSYSTETTGKTYYNVPTKFIVTNNEAFLEETSYQGTIVLRFTLDAYEVKNNSSGTYDVNFKTTDGTEIKAGSFDFTFESARTPYTLDVRTEAFSSASGLPGIAENFVWVKYKFDYEKGSTGVREAFGKNLYITVPDGAIVFDSNFTQLANEGNNTYNLGKYKETLHNNTLNEYISVVEPNTITAIVAYPKATTTNVNLTANLYGTYRDELAEVLLDTESISKASSEFEFDYDGELYWIGKSTKTPNISYESLIGNNGANAKWNLYYGARYSEEIGSINMICGDDILYAQDANYNWYQLSDSEYSFTSFDATYAGQNKYLGLRNMNTYVDVSDKYEVAVYLRYANTTDYVLWKQGKLNANGIGSVLTFPANVVGVQFKILNSNNEDIELYGDLTVNFKSTKMASDTDIYNFNYLEIQKNSDNQLVNLEITEENYITAPTKEHIMQYDLNKYGHLMFRNTHYVTAGDTKAYYTVTKDINQNSITIDANNEKINFNYISSTVFWFNQEVAVPKEFYGYTMYDLLPEGIDLAVTADELKEGIAKCMTFFTAKFQTVNGNYTSNRYSYLMNHLNVEVIEDYEGTGRTFIKIEVDMSDDPLDLTYTWNYDNDNGRFTAASSWPGEYFLYQIPIPCQISFDNWYEYGSTYTNTLFVSDTNHSKGYSSTINRFGGTTTSSLLGQTPDNGSFQTDPALQSIMSDLDKDGNTTESIGTSTISEAINATMNTYTDIIKRISVDQENYTTQTQKVKYNSDYSYKLRVRIGVDNTAKNLVIFDSIEDVSPGWKGHLQGFDTSYAEGKGYQVKIYYSESDFSTTEKYTTDITNSFWKEYVDGVTDLSTIKHVAFTFLDQQGNSVVFPSNSVMYVTILMKSISTTKALNAQGTNAADLQTANNARFTIDALDTFGAVQEVVDLPSNTVYAVLPSIGFQVLKIIPTNTEAYELMGMDPDAQYSFQVKFTNKTTGRVVGTGTVKAQLTDDGKIAVNPILLNGLTIGDTYIIEEVLDNNSLFEFDKITNRTPNGVSLNLVDGKYEFVVNENIDSDITLQLVINNNINLKTIDLNINKVIEGTDRAFEYHNASRNDEFNFNIKLTNKADNTFKRGTLSSKTGLTINDIYPGTYIIEETNLDEYWIFKSMAAAGILDGVTLTQVNGKYELTIANTVVDDSVYSINITNELTKPTQINLSISKTISGTDRAFELLDYTRDDTFSFPVSIQHQTNNTDSQTGTVTNKTPVTFNNLNVGKYLITETVPENWLQTAITSSNSVNGVTLTKEGNNYYINIAENATDGATFSIVINNELQETREPTIKIVFSKEIVGTVAAFENLKLDPNGEYAFQMNVVNGNYRIHGIVTNRQNLTFAEVPIGTYVVTETKDFKFDFVQMQALNSIAGVTFEKVGNQYILTVGEDITDRSTLLVKVTNEVRPDAYYDGKDDKVNLFVWNHEENG